MFVQGCILLFCLSLTSWTRAFLPKLTGSQLVKNSPAFYGTGRFITAFTSARHLSLSWARSVQLMPSHPTDWRSILILSSHHIPLPEDPTEYYPPNCSWVSQVVPFPQVSPPKPSLSVSSHHTCYMRCPQHTSRFDQPKNIGWGIQIIKFINCNSLHSPVPSSLLGPNILLSTLFSNTFSLSSYLNVGDQVPYPQKTTGKIIFLN